MFLTALLMLQGYLPFNPQGLSGLSWHLAFNTAASFVTNTNWQSYAGEAALGYLAQSLGLTVQNFVSAATGIAVLFVLLRALAKAEHRELGNFWVDLTRIPLYLLLPLNLVVASLLLLGGVPQEWTPARTTALLEPLAVTATGDVLPAAAANPRTGNVTLHGDALAQTQIVTEQFVPTGPVASQVAIKQTGTNGGGFFGTNSSHPLENPNPFTNLVEVLSILLIPTALCFTFGLAVRQRRQGFAIFAAMALCLVIGLAAIGMAEQSATAQLAQHGAVDLGTIQQAGGNMEGKETRFGITGSSVWAAFTTATSSDSVNSMHDSFTPLGGLIAMFQMQLGEIIFGGVGCGLYNMLAFVILTVFIAGLLVGRTPEFLGKKIEPYEMKWSVVICLATPVFLLIGAGLAAGLPSAAASVSQHGPHGLSELLYAYSSAAGNNGSAFAGLQADTPFINTSLALIMLAVRFLPIVGVLAISGSLAPKRRLAVTAGTLSTSGGLFIFLLIVTILLIGGLSFFPALALGPLAEHFSALP